MDITNTVAILAQGTNWAVAVTQAFFLNLMNTFQLCKGMYICVYVCLCLCLCAWVLVLVSCCSPASECNLISFDVHDSPAGILK